MFKKLTTDDFWTGQPKQLNKFHFRPRFLPIN